VLKILVDEDMPRPTSKLLVSLGVDAIDVRDVGLKGASDEQVFRFAHAEERIIITRDKEFGNILRYPPDSHRGIILVRVPYNFVRDQILGLVRMLFTKVDKTKLLNNLTVLEVNRFRIKGRAVNLKSKL